jgi:dTDP-4-dehydrorhamnose reductase
MRLLVIGGSGLVGSNIVDVATDTDLSISATHHNVETDHTDTTLDKTDYEKTAAIVEDFKPDAIVDTAAFHAVDDCESERKQAWSVNAAGTRNVAAAADDIGAHYIYLSTDYVFAGKPAEAPYSEDDSVSPINYYAQTKYAGEQAGKIPGKSTILRPSVIYGLASENFVTWVLGELQAGNEVTIVDDQVSTPTYAPDLARACLTVATDGITGLYHAAGPESLSRYKFTVKLAEAGGFETDLVSPISTEEFGQKASRPADSSLDSTALYSAIGNRFKRPSQAFEAIYRDW